jgi:hypothetical protein
MTEEILHKTIKPRIPIELISNEEFVDFAVKHYFTLWEIAIKTAELVSSRFETNMWTDDLVEGTFRSVSIGCACILEAFLSRQEIKE